MYKSTTLKMLEKIRRLLEPVFQSLGLYFSSTDLSPNFWTIVSFLLSIVSGIFFSISGQVINFPPYYMSLIAGILLLASGFFDLIDGAVARVSKRYSYSKSGAFLDSCLDKI